MYTSLKVSLELNSLLSKRECRLLTEQISKVLNGSSKIKHLIKEVRFEDPATKLSSEEIRRMGGQARAASMTAKQRSEIARKGALARWGKEDK
jgi:hypothetical protein